MTSSGGTAGFISTTHFTYWFEEVTRVSEIAEDEKSKREELKAKRDLLFKLFLKNPMYTHLAAEIKVIDDQLAESYQKLEQH
jgi:hypothetical protein